MPQAARLTEDPRLVAIRARDPAADGRFLYSVATTGIYCHPSCAARPALAHNVAFHANAEAAERAGFRPCKRCRPDLPPKSEREAALVAAACRRIEAAEEAPALAELAASAGLSAFHFHRLFRRIAGVTPKAYADARRQALVQDRLASGSPVTPALYEAGFNAASRFYAKAGEMLGMAPSRYRAGGAREAIGHATGACSLGTVLVAGTAQGICAILLGADPAALLDNLNARFPRAAIAPAAQDFAALVARVVALIDDPAGAHARLPLDIRGTVFQRRVWEALRAIPPGETLSYAALAAQLGSPGAARAVAGACAANALAVAIPCHRVVAGDGSLAGYRWGLARKQALLERERG